MTQFERVLKDQEVLEGQSVELDVRVSRKVTSVSWLKDEDVLTRTTSVNDLTKREDGRLCFESNFVTGEHKLSISECVLSDTGHYKCKAESDNFASSCSANLTILRNQKISTGSEASLSQRLTNTLKRHKKSRTSELQPSSIKPKMSRAASTNLSEISPRPKLIVSPSEDNDNNSPSPAPSSIDMQSPTAENQDQLLVSHASSLNIASSGPRKLSAFLENSLSRFKARHVSDDNLSQSLNLSGGKMTSSLAASGSGSSPQSRTMPRRADTINLGSEYVRKPRRKMGSMDFFK